MSTPQTTTDDYTVFGVDISDNQENLNDLITKKTHNLTFIICKATEGNTYVDKCFKTNWPAIKSNGLIRGSYHFYRYNDNPVTQADNYINTVGTLLHTDLPPILDFEEGSIKGFTFDEKQKHHLELDLLKFLKIMETKTKRKPIIYTDFNTAKLYLTNPAFASYNLWISRPNKPSPLPLPSVWESQKWTLWQQSTKHDVEKNKLDFDIFNGNHTEFLKFIQSTVIETV